MNMKRKEGITLIALVITIIVLLILAGVSIAMLTGQNGILSQAQNAKNKTELSSEKEQIKLAVQASITKNPDTLEITKTNLEEGIQEQLGNNREFETTDNQDGSFIVNLKNPDKMYYVEETGKVIAEENMLKISTADELKAFRDNVNNGNTYEGWYVYLANDITLDINEEWEPIGLYPNENTSPEDATNKPFSGVFDGKNYEINELYINTSDKVQGLFGIVIGGTIKNVGIGENNNITGGLSTGAVAGYLYNGSQIINCYNKSDLTCGSISGGVVGQISKNSNMKNCYNLGNINTADGNTLGGIVGGIGSNSSMKESYNSGSISGNNVTGGIAGSMSSNSMIEECYNSGDVNGEATIGGVVAKATINAVTKNCYNVGSIEGNNSIGGIVGEQSAGEICNCYNTGIITGTDKVGGIVGTNNVYNLTTVIIKNAYSLEGVCDNLYGYNGTGSIIEESSIKTSDEVKSLFSILGNVFKEDVNNINNGYPILNWQ